MKFANGRGIGAAVVVSWALGGCGMLLGLDEYGPQTCDDRAKGAGEADVDCGGICGKACGVGMGCGAPGDCESQMCSALGRCEAATCADGLKNADESDKDCGGSCGPTCGAGLACEGHGDCAGGVCESGVCAATCSDGEKNADESDVDCGGPGCGATCGPGAACKANGDCVGGACEGSVCAPTCTDKAKSGDESDVDCGGMKCDPCEVGQGCVEAADCQSGVCHAEGCVAEHVWSTRFGDADKQEALSVTIDKSGNVILAGTVHGTVDFGGGPITSPPEGSYFVTKRNSAGKHLWTKLFGNPLSAKVRVGVDSSGNIFISCTSSPGTDFGGGPLSGIDNSDIYIARLDPDGNHVWSKAFWSNGYDGVDSIQFTSQGTLLLAGEFGGVVTFGGSILNNTDNFVDLFLAEFDTDGGHIWSKSYQCSASFPPVSMAIDSSGNIILGGGFFGKEVNFGGGPLTGAGGMDIFLAKLDPSGKHIWSKRFGDVELQVVNGIATGMNDDIFLAGQFRASFDLGGSTLPYQGGSDAFVARLGSSGNHLWSKAFGDSADQSAQRISTDDSGKVIFGGSMIGSADFGGGSLTADDEDVFLATLTVDGSHVWSRRYSGPDVQLVKSIAVDKVGNLVVAGDFQGSISFGGDQLTTAGSLDVFIAKLAYP